MKPVMKSLATEYSNYAAVSIPSMATIKKTTRAQWSGLWRAFRALRTLLGEKQALKLIETHCRHDALLILEVIL
jgi:hypothetical protein